jgi:16S rRNA C967 or C1407 C5-methylase (RsmB/RsmF family)
MKKLSNEFKDRLNKIYSKEDLKIVEKWFKTEKRKPSFRINRIKGEENDIIKEIEKKWLKISKVEYLVDWYVLEEWKERDLWDLDIFKLGKIYMQQITSQIPVQFLDLKEWNKVLDVTAAPGSKTTQIASILNNSWKIIAVDNNQIRVDKLTYNLKRQWIKNVKIIKADARNIQIELSQIEEKNGYSKDGIFEKFDNILFDAPCSAEGRINLNIEKTYAFWKPEIISRNYKLQKQILQKIIPLLKKGWTLVYSTCTLAPEENEAVTHFILSNYPELEIQEIKLDNKFTRPWIKIFWKQVFRNDVVKSMRILPSEESEGFYIAKFKKN